MYLEGLATRSTGMAKESGRPRSAIKACRLRHNACVSNRSHNTLDGGQGTSREQLCSIYCPCWRIHASTLSFKSSNQLRHNPAKQTMHVWTHTIHMYFTAEQQCSGSHAFTKTYHKSEVASIENSNCKHTLSTVIVQRTTACLMQKRYVQMHIENRVLRQ